MHTQRKQHEKYQREKTRLCWLQTHSYAISKSVTPETTDVVFYSVVKMKNIDFNYNNPLFVLNAATTNLENKIQFKR